MINTTLEKFGFPHGLIREYRHWAVLLRPHQATLGALILGAKSDAQSFAALDAGAFTELHHVTAEIESGLRRFRPFQKINYLMLMMVDPHVHFHVLPRYSAPQRHGSLLFEDMGWPGAPDLGGGMKPGPEDFTSLLAGLKAAWPA